MSEIIDTEWFTKGGADQSIGIVLIYNIHDGFKCYIGTTIPNTSEDDGAEYIYQNGVKIDHKLAEAVWGRRMTAEWINRHIGFEKAQDLEHYKYDGKLYPTVSEA